MRTRVVLDANIYISALIKPSGPPGNALKYILEHSEFELVLSDTILEELKRVLFYPKARKYIKKTDDEIHLWLDALVVQAYLPQSRFSHEPIVKEDPDDDKYVLAALESSALYLVSGDSHLLKLKSYQRIKIVTAAAFAFKAAHSQEKKGFAPCLDSRP